MKSPSSSEVLSAKLPKEKARLVEKILIEEKVDKSTILLRALEHYTREWKILKAAVMIFDLGIWGCLLDLFPV